MLARSYRVARTLAMAVVLAYLGWQLIRGWPSLEALHVAWSGPALAAALLASWLGYQCLFVGWLALLRRAGHFEARHLRAYGRVWWTSYLYRYVPGRVMLVVERARLGAALGIPPALGTAIALAESLLAMLAGAWVSLLAALYHAQGAAGILSAVVVITLAVVLLVALLRRLLAAGTLAERQPGLAALALGPRALAALLPPFLLHYLLQGLALFLCLRMLQPFPWSDLAGLCGVYALAHVVGLVTLVAPAGLGVREGALGVQLLRVLPAGVAEAAALGSRLGFTLVELLAFATAVALSPAAGAAERSE